MERRVGVEAAVSASSPNAGIIDVGESDADLKKVRARAIRIRSCFWTASSKAWTDSCSA